MKVFFFGSDRYSQIVHKSLRQDKNIKICEVITPAMMIRIIIAKLGEVKPELGVLASFGAVIPKKVLDLFPKGVLNLHPSLLPKYRGSSPVQTAILNGEKRTGLTIIKMDEKIDHGPIVTQFEEEILPVDTAESLYYRLFSAGAKILKTILSAYLEGRIQLRSQDHSQATYTKKLTREDGKIDWQKPTEYLDRFIRAMFPWPAAWTEVKITRNSQLVTLKLKIHKAHLQADKLIFDLVQLEGKNPVTYKQFCEGYPKVKIIS